MPPETITLEVFRYSPDAAVAAEDRPVDGPETTAATRGEGYFQSYEVPYTEDTVVLDALNHIKDQLDGTLSFRWSCRMGVCGSCGMVVNGDAKLTCSTFLRDLLPGPVRVEPLDNFPVVRDLVVEMSDFMEKLKSVSPWIIRKEEKPLDEGVYLQTPAELADYKQFTMCINCVLCYSACPVVGMSPDFLGPAALAIGHRYNLDTRDEGFKERREDMHSHDGIWDCTFIGQCSAVCPKHVDPAAAIQQAKVAATQDWFLSKLMPRSQRRTVKGRSGDDRGSKGGGA